MVAVALAIVFGIWYRKEGTLSIHSIVTVPRELFYWLAILLTFALGTAAGDWTLEITGWAPGTAVLLPVFLIIATVVGWRLGANAVLSFWIAYVLTRPLGANIGDWLAVDKKIGGLGVGTLGTSAIFLSAIVATVIYLVVRRPDVIDEHTVAREAAARAASTTLTTLGCGCSGMRSSRLGVPRPTNETFGCLQHRNGTHGHHGHHQPTRRVDGSVEMR